MAKLWMIFLLCFLGAAMAGAFDESKDKLTGNLLVKREALPEAKKSNGVEVKKRMKNKNARKKSSRKGNKPKKEIKGREAKARRNKGETRKERKVKKMTKSKEPNRKNERKNMKKKSNKRNKKRKGKEVTKRRNAGQRSKGINQGKVTKNMKKKSNKRNKKRKGKEVTKRRNAGQRSKGINQGKVTKKWKKETARRKKGKTGKKKKQKQATKKAIGTKRRKWQENVQGKRKNLKKVNKMQKKNLLQNRLAINYTECAVQVLKYSKLNEQKARTIDRQVSRINKRMSDLNKKQAKQGEFVKTYEILKMVLGGNESQLECNGEPANASIEGILSTLSECQENIADACKYTLASSDNSTLQDCLTAAKQFRAEIKTCSTAKNGCTCMLNNITSSNYQMLEQCVVPKQTNNETNRQWVNKCLPEIKACKLAQVNSIEVITNCTSHKVIGGSSDPIINTTTTSALTCQPASAGSTTPSPIKTIITREEGGQIVTQENSYQPATGVLEMRVPRHGSYEESLFLLHKESKTSMLRTRDICQVTDLPANIVVGEDVAEGNVTIKPTKKFFLKAKEAVLGSKKREEQRPEVLEHCEKSQMVQTRDIEINETEYEKYKRDQIITVTKKESRSLLVCEPIEKCSREGPSACGANGLNTGSQTLSVHSISDGSVCVKCYVDNPCGDSDYCNCTEIDDKNSLYKCMIPPKYICDIEPKESGADILLQKMVFNQKDQGVSLTFESPTYENMSKLITVYHAHPNGYWDIGGLKNNRLIKMGNSCLISTLPRDIFPYNYAIDTQKTKAGNQFCIPENDELNKTTILRNDGSLTKDEENALHPDIALQCSGSIKKKIRKLESENDVQIEKLKNGEIVFLDSKCKGKETAAKVSDSGSWRFPNREGPELWIHETIHSLSEVTCCKSGSCDETRFCQCDSIVDDESFRQCGMLQDSTEAEGELDCGWLYHGGNEYKLYTTALTWDKAEEKCREKNASLASIHDKETNEFVNNLQSSRNTYLWIGGTRERESSIESGWYWSDNSDWDFENWNKGEPNNVGQEYCIMTWHSQTWNDQSCSDTLPFVCQKLNQSSTSFHNRSTTTMTPITNTTTVFTTTARAPTTPTVLTNTTAFSNKTTTTNTTATITTTSSTKSTTTQSTTTTTSSTKSTTTQSTTTTTTTSSTTTTSFTTTTPTKTTSSTTTTTSTTTTPSTTTTTDTTSTTTTTA